MGHNPEEGTRTTGEFEEGTRTTGEFEEGTSMAEGVVDSRAGASRGLAWKVG